MEKRNLFDEVMEGFDALRAAKDGKITLREHKVTAKAVEPVTPAELRNLRDRIGASRSVMASYLRTNDRTLERWEQGRSKPNEQATILIRLVGKYPDMLERLLTL